MRKSSVTTSEPDETGHWGKFGGRYVPETLVAPLDELTKEFTRARHDLDFWRELDQLLRYYCGRPTPLFHAQRLSARGGGAQIYLKREDLLHTGAHKINNAMGQALLHSEWANVASLLKQVQASTALRRRQFARSSACT